MAQDGMAREVMHEVLREVIPYNPPTMPPGGLHRDAVAGIARHPEGPANGP
jgi:hypothetical protein